MYQERVKIGLSLSGGGARGFAHVGVIQALLEEDIVPDVVAGTSAGSVVGALYAAGFSPAQMIQFIESSSFLKLVKIGIPSGGLSRLTYLRQRLSEAIPEDNFASLERPLWVAITNLNSGRLEFRNEGDLYDVVMASCSIPLVFQPVEMNEQLFVDGGVLCNLPVEPLLGQADYIVGVNLIPPVEVSKKNLNGVVSIAYRCFDLSIWANTQPQSTYCDYILEPAGIEGFTIFQYNKFQQLYELGYERTKAAIPEIKEQLKFIQENV